MSLSDPIFFFFFFFSLLPSIFHSSHSSPIPVDEASLWNNPTLYTGDSIALPPQEWAMSPEISPAPSSGEDVSPASTFSWPFQPESAGKGGMALINSNPAASVPAAGVDSATIRPTPNSADQPTVKIEILPFHVAFHSMAFLIPLLL